MTYQKVQMSEKERTISNLVLRLSMTGLVAGVGLFIATNWLVMKGGPVVGPHLSLLGQFFIGYRVTFVGSLVGLAYGFGCGFIAGSLVARLYNWLARLREKQDRD